jgi:hypothetical protein
MRRIVSICVLALVVSGCAVEAATSGRIAVSDGRSAAAVRFTQRDRALIQDYYAEHKVLPPGLAKRGTLPPGLARHQALPPGLQQRTLPSDLESRLTPLPWPYVRVQVDSAVVLLNRSTRAVLDLIQLGN